MRSWLILLGGLIVWAVHFFAAYALGEILGETLVARVALGVLTLACFAADIVLIVATGEGDGSEFDRWRRALARTGALISAVAVLWQGLPGLLAGAG